MTCEGCRAYKRKASAQRDNWKRRALAYEVEIRRVVGESLHLSDGGGESVSRLRRVLEEQAVNGGGK